MTAAPRHLLYVCQPCANYRAPHREEWQAHLRSDEHAAEMEKHRSSSVVDSAWPTGFELRKSATTGGTQWIALYDHNDKSFTRAEFKWELEQCIRLQGEVTAKIKKLCEREIAGPPR